MNGQIKKYKLRKGNRWSKLSKAKTIEEIRNKDVFDPNFIAKLDEKSLNPESLMIPDSEASLNRYWLYIVNLDYDEQTGMMKGVPSATRRSYSINEFDTLFSPEGLGTKKFKKFTILHDPTQEVVTKSGGGEVYTLQKKHKELFGYESDFTSPMMIQMAIDEKLEELANEPVKEEEEPIVIPKAPKKPRAKKKVAEKDIDDMVAEAEKEIPSDDAFGDLM